MLNDITSLTWRPLTPEDAQASADLINANEAVDRVGEFYTAQDTLQELISPYAELERASLGVFDGDVMVGFMKVVYRPAAQDVHRMMMDGNVLADYRRRGIGTALVESGLAAAKVVHAQFHPTLKLEIIVRKMEGVAGVAELMASQGFAPVTYDEYMTHPLGDAIPDVAIPDGLRIEPWSELNDEEFRMIRNESFADVGSSPMPVDNWKNRMTDHALQPEVSFLVRNVADGAPVGMVLTKFWEGDVAVTGVRDLFFFAIGTLRDHRRRGVAGALLAHALRTAADQGFDSASMNVDSSAASGIYGKAGFAPKKRIVVWSREV